MVRRSVVVQDQNKVYSTGKNQTSFKERWERHPIVVIVTFALALSVSVVTLWKAFSTPSGSSNEVGNTTFTQINGSRHVTAQHGRQLSLPEQARNLLADPNLVVPTTFRAYPLADGSIPTDEQRKDLYILDLRFLTTHMPQPAVSPIEPQWINAELKKMGKSYRVLRRGTPSSIYIDQGVETSNLSGNHVS